MTIFYIILQKDVISSKDIIRYIPGCKDVYLTIIYQNRRVEADRRKDFRCPKDVINIFIFKRHEIYLERPVSTRRNRRIRVERRPSKTPPLPFSKRNSYNLQADSLKVQDSVPQLHNLKNSFATIVIGLSVLKLFQLSNGDL